MSVASAWEAYRGAIAALLEPAAAEMVEDVQRSEGLVEAAVGASARLGDEVATLLEADAPVVRELAVLQLNAAAVVDLAAADYLAGLAHGSDDVPPLDEPPPVQELPASEQEQARARAALARDLEAADPILRTEPGAWPPVIIGGAPVSGGRRQLLELEAGRSLERISGDAVHAAQEVFLGGVLALALPHVLSACRTPIDDVFGNAARVVGPRLKRVALKLVHQGVRKLFAVFGSGAKQVKEQVQEWVEERLQAWGVNATRARVERWIKDDLYEIEAIETHLAAVIEDASGDAKMPAATIELVHLARRFGDHMRVLEWLVSKLRRIAPWIVTLGHVWGTIGLAAGYVAGTGFAVLSGGDYVDWRGSQSLFDLVPGVQAIVEQAC